MKLFIWDFHGTLEKGNEFGALELSNLSLEKHGFSQRFRDEHVLSLYGKKWYEYFEFLLPNESHETHVRLQQTCFEWPDAEKIVSKYVQLNDNARKVLEMIRRKGHSQIVISNTSKTALPIFLKLVGIDDIFGRNNAFAVMAHTKDVKKSKLDVVNEYLKAYDSPPEMIVIGDSDKDMLLAEQLNALGFWYRHPHHPVPEIVKQHPKLIAINDLRKVLSAA